MHDTSAKQAALAVTAGEPAGIGLDLLAGLASTTQAAQLVYVGAPELLIDRANLLSQAIKLIPFDAQTPQCGKDQKQIYQSKAAENIPQAECPQLSYWPVACKAEVSPGQLTTATSPYVLETLEAAVRLCESGATQAMVTGPVHKGIINDAGIPFSGHTGWLKERTKADNVVMLLANAQLRVALTTTHIPLNAVSDAFTAERLKRTLQTVHAEIQMLYRLPKPRIAVCGLNPHAGEGGHLGTEEQRILEPLLDELRNEGMEIVGPLPADTAFIPSMRSQYDVCLTHYHDQGLPVLKALDFEGAINVSLGLPIIRTSVDHGTALPLAGTGKASPKSFQAAVKAASFFAESRLNQAQSESAEAGANNVGAQENTNTAPNHKNDEHNSPTGAQESTGA